MRILVVNPFGGTESYGRENLERIKRPDTEFDMVNIADVYPLNNNQFIYFRYGCMEGTIDRVIRAEKEGYDAVFLSCNLDIALYECRQLLQIPVTATLESAAHWANMMGRRFSLLSVDYQNGEIQRMMLETYGLAHRLASVRSIDIDARDLYPERTSPRAVRERCIQVARRCVEEDGAEVIIPGCTLAGSVLTHDLDDPQAVIGAPVVDGMVTGFKMAEMAADMRLKAGVPSVSRRGFFQFPPRDDYEKLRRHLNKEI